MTRKVGYGSPPDHTKWEKGTSGNPNGRPKGAKNFATIIDAELSRKVKTPDGKWVSFADLIVKKMISEALKGHLKALEMLLRLQGSGQADTAAEAWTSADSKLFDEFKAGVLSDLAKDEGATP